MKKIMMMGIMLILAGSAQAAVSLTGSAVSAVKTLSAGLGDGASYEASSQAGFKAQQTLMGLGTKDLAAGVYAAPRGVAAAAPAEAASLPVMGLTIQDVPAPPAGRQEEKKGFFGRMADKAKTTWSKADKTKKIAMLVGLLAIEGAVIAFPAQAITVVFVGLGVLGLFGTTRELIGAIRRRSN